MQTPAVLFDFISVWDIAIFFSVPLLLLIVVFFQEYFDWKSSHHGRW